jgi:hypothetical protein
MDEEASVEIPQRVYTPEQLAQKQAQKAKAEVVMAERIAQSAAKAEAADIAAKTATIKAALTKAGKAATLKEAELDTLLAAAGFV